MIDNKEIEERLASALNAAAPDMLDELMTELGSTSEKAPQLRDRLAENEHDRHKRAIVRSNGFRRFMSLAAAFVILLGGVSVWRSAEQKVLAVVDLDVNPSIELSLNGRDKVVEARPVNEDGEAILAGMDLRGSDVKVACNAIVGSMLMKGYLNEQSNSILVSVRADDEAKGREIEEEISDSITSYMEDSAVAAAILGQYVEDDDELKEFAERNGISTGKAWLIRSLLETGDGKMTEESLLALTTQELIVLSQERNVAGEAIRGRADTGKYVGYEAALNTALSHAGLKRSQVSDAEVEMDCENGVIIYEVEFNHGGREYEYEIVASSGKVASSRKDASSKKDADYDDDEDNDKDDDDDDEWDDENHYSKGKKSQTREADDDDDDDKDDDDDDEEDDD